MVATFFGYVLAVVILLLIGAALAGRIKKAESDVYADVKRAEAGVVAKFEGAKAGAAADAARAVAATKDAVDKAL